MRKAVIAGLSCAVFAFSAHAAAAQTSTNPCFAQETKADERLADCSKWIASGQLSGEKLAAAYDNRGSAYAAKQDDDHAIADYDQAIKLNAQDTGAYFNRGTAWFNKGDFNRATADFDQAIKLNPQFARAYLNRGYAYFEKRDYDKAIADLDACIRLDPSERMAPALKAQVIAAKSKRPG
jgi:tetratricopeptide (TPR) repeat protein